MWNHFMKNIFSVKFSRVFKKKNFKKIQKNTELFSKKYFSISVKMFTCD